MQDRILLIKQLRTIFKNGTTPSGILDCVLTQKSDAISHRELCGIMEEAFSVPFVRLSLSSTTPERDFRGVILNKTLLADLVQGRSDWDKGERQGPRANSCWMDGLIVKKLEEIADEVRSAPYPGLSEKSWSALSYDEQQTLYTQIVSSIVISQRVEVLSRLAERLPGKD